MSDSSENAHHAQELDGDQEKRVGEPQEKAKRQMM
jgi:hypothetical protein